MGGNINHTIMDGRINKCCFIVFAAILSAASLSSFAACQDFEIQGTFEASLDLPRILFLLKHSPNEPPIEVEGYFELNYAFLDTGASGLLMSKETAEVMQIAIDPNGQFVDTGIGGDEYFDVSENLYIGVTDYDSPDPYNPDVYSLYGPWRFQVKQEYVEWPEEPLDVLGIPVMAGKTAVLKPITSLDIEDIRYFTADIKEANDPNIPETDFQVALRFEKYINPTSPENIPPLPVLAYNPVIDNVTVEYNGASSTGNLLLDTGGTISLISVAQAVKLGLTDANGDPIVPIDFSIPIGGIGGSVELPGYILDKLSVPTLSGFDLVYINARVCVHDIGIYDVQQDQWIVLDGIFGDNFICASMDMATWDMSGTPFDNIVIDTQNALLGFDVNSAYPLPVCQFTDLNNDCIVNEMDLSVLGDNWLATDCNSSNGFCDGSDIDKDGNVNFSDYTILAGDWGDSNCQHPCGSEQRPFPPADLNRDCTVDLYDFDILAAEWLNSCDWLNWNCRGSDFDRNGTVNFEDYQVFSDNW